MKLGLYINGLWQDLGCYVSCFILKWQFGVFISPVIVVPVCVYINPRLSTGVCWVVDVSKVLWMSSGRLAVLHVSRILFSGVPYVLWRCLVWFHWVMLTLLCFVSSWSLVSFVSVAHSSTPPTLWCYFSLNWCKAVVCPTTMAGSGCHGCHCSGLVVLAHRTGSCSLLIN